MNYYIYHMKRLRILAASLLLVHAVAAQDYATLVNPFIGTGGHGHTYPGASMPFGMMQLSPDTRLEGWDGCGGYHYSDSMIYGFSHTHLSGTGVSDYGDVLLMPFTGSVKWNNSEYASPFSHKNEEASAGFYQVLLDKHNIDVSLTTSYRSGMHRYVYKNKPESGNILIDLEHRDEVLESEIEMVSAFEIRGYRRSKAWANDQRVYFVIQFNQPVSAIEFMVEGKLVNNEKKATGKKLKCALYFNSTKGGNTILARVGISAVSREGAAKNLAAEINHWDFKKLHQTAKNAWNRELGKIAVKGGSPDEQVVFYTALYHTMLSPNMYMDVDGQYRGTDLKVHKAKGFTNYTVFSLWDTYRALHPLMTIINQKRTNDWINTFLMQYKNGGMLPVWELSACETFCMIGYHSVPVIVDAYQKGIRGFDTRLALEAMKSYAESKRFGLQDYARNGFLSNDREHESVSKTLEYAYDDWCIAQFARMNGWKTDYQTYIKRAQSYKNLYDPGTQHMRGKVQAMWYAPFDAREINNFYTEGNSWQYSFAVPQDIEGLMVLMGGREVFGNKLRELFTTSSVLTGRDQSDVTGLIGQYAHGNEPSHHMAYLFNYVGRPAETQELVHRICHQFYKNEPDGLIGNEDCGQMSAWYVLSAMGFYPVCPGNGEYAIGTPLFDEVKISLENGKTFTITSKRETVGSFFVKDLQLNGKKHASTVLKHTDIMGGGKLVFTLHNKSTASFGTSDKDIPFTAITDNLILPVPYIKNESSKFRDEATVVLASIDPKAEIHYSFLPEGSPEKERKLVKYEQPFTISGSGKLYAICRKGNLSSTGVTQQFYKIKTDRSVQVLTKVNPMYTGGGPDALIDGLTGGSNYRTGEWQSYYGNDFEAIIDLKNVRTVHTLSGHFLQDAGSWIFMPREVFFETSEDGVSYTPAGSVKHSVGEIDYESQVATLSLKGNWKARFVKIKAINYGTLPAWHLGAGGQAHIFVDEVGVE
jgi:predicted alpha-1,2-mannosidase